MVGKLLKVLLIVERKLSSVFKFFEIESDYWWRFGYVLYEFCDLVVGLNFYFLVLGL